jgi:hypothetical protein
MRADPRLMPSAYEECAPRARIVWVPPQSGKTTGMETAHATHGRPPVVSQTEWDAARTALLERERNVAAAMHELAAAR